MTDTYDRTADLRQQPGACPDCEDGQRIVSTHANGFRDTMDCVTCKKGTGQQPSALDKYNTDLGHRLREAGVGQRPAQPDGPRWREFSDTTRLNWVLSRYPEMVNRSAIDEAIAREEFFRSKK